MGPPVGWTTKLVTLGGHDLRCFPVNSRFNDSRVWEYGDTTPGEMTPGCVSHVETSLTQCHFCLINTASGCCGLTIMVVNRVGVYCVISKQNLLDTV